MIYKPSNLLVIEKKKYLTSSENEERKLKSIYFVNMNKTFNSGEKEESITTKNEK